MRQRQFEQQLRDLLRVPVEGWTTHDKVTAVHRHLDVLASGPRDLDRFDLRFEPFVPGRRPDDEAEHPGLGSSEQVGLFNAGRSPGDRVKLLVRLSVGDRLVADLPTDASVVATIEAVDDADAALATVVGWARRDVTALLVPVGSSDAPSHPTVRPRALQLDLDVNEIFCPDATDVDDCLGFGTHFHQRYRVSLDVVVGEARIAGDEIAVDVFNEALFGSLYQRLVDVLLADDTARQARAAGLGDGLSIASHPWFPVLCIGMQKARLYMSTIASDLVDQRRSLTDPGWLLRIGLYLELLTCLGIAEAVRGSIDILTPAERRHFEQSPCFAEFRTRLDVDAWTTVWQLRRIGFGRRGTPGAANLLRKKSATFAFLHAHHEDLKQAIELAGPNLHNAQETWHRVFRDAERAVLQMNRDAFPELRELPAVAREFALWHESGSVGRKRLVPRQLTEIFGDQDGVFPSACRQYRASMNYVALWALGNGLMEYTGPDCIPTSASLLEAHLSNRPSLLARLQWRDGFVGSLEVRHEEPQPLLVDHDVAFASLERVELLSALTVDELRSLAAGVRPIELGHLERILIQGREGSSLFILHDGELEVIARRGDRERQLAVLTPPAVVGELAFLLDEPRSATVRAIEQAVVLEIGATQLRPLVEARPALLDALTALLDERRRLVAAVSTGSLRERVTRAIFSG